MPAGVLIATASASGIEWLTAKNSHSNGPNRCRSPSTTSTLGRLDAVLGELGLDQRQRQLRPHERDVAPLAQQVRHGADVVLVRVGQHHGLDVVEAIPDVFEVGQDQVDAGLVGLGEQHPAVDDQQPAVVLEDGHVAADLAEPAQRDDAQAALGQRRRRPELGMGVAHPATPLS